MPRLTATPEFERLCGAFHQDCLVFAPTPDDLARDALQHISAAEHDAVKSFLDRLLDGRYTASELRGLMNRSAPALRWSSESALTVLTAIRQRLDTLT